VHLTSTRLCSALAIAASFTFVTARADAQTAYAQPAAPVPYAYPGYPPPAYYPPAPPPIPPARISYVEGRPIPAGYHLDTQPRKGLVVTGAVLFGGMYVISASVAGSSKHDGDSYLFVPVIGPFIDMSTRGSTNCASSAICDTSESSTRFLLTLDALTQLTGATLLTIGLASPKKILERDDAPIMGRDTSTFRWAVAPRSFRGGFGVGVGGEF
jgi:hypothetical protein